MSDVSKLTMPVAFGPLSTQPSVSKLVLYVAYTRTPPARKGVMGRVRYGDGN